MCVCVCVCVPLDNIIINYIWIIFYDSKDLGEEVETLKFEGFQGIQEVLYIAKEANVY